MYMFIFSYFYQYQKIILDVLFLSLQLVLNMYLYIMPSLCDIESLFSVTYYILYYRISWLPSEEA